MQTCSIGSVTLEIKCLNHVGYVGFAPLCVISGVDDDAGFDDERSASGDSHYDYDGDGTDHAAAAAAATIRRTTRMMMMMMMDDG